MSQPLRLFVAVPIPLLLKRQLGEWIKEKQKKWYFNNWIHSQDIHITLQFLGNTTTQQLNKIKLALLKLSKTEIPFSLSLSGIGTFGQVKQPRILWAGLEGDIDQLHQLQQKVTGVLSLIGFPPEARPYRPHITLARKYNGDDFLSFPPDPSLWKTMDSSWTVEQFTLYQSKLGQKPMYEVISTFSFMKQAKK